MQSRRKTKQRRLILEELQKLHSHPTATDLYCIVRQRLPRISLGTVYRNLELLADSGCIRKIQIVGREARFDANFTDHHHIQCTSCGRTDDIPSASQILAEIPKDNPGGWQIQECRVEYVGLCPDCSTEGADQKA